MKLQKQLSRKYGSKEYAKWVLVIPQSKVQEVGFKEGQELSIRKEGKGLVITAAKK